MSYLFNTFLYNPLYNALVLLTDILPGADIGIAVIVLTLLVRLLILPLETKQLHTTTKIAEIKGQIDEINKKYADNKEERARKTLELYRINKINPFAGFFLILIQIPIIIALYWVFLKGIPFKSELLYSFVRLPETVNFNFLGLFDLATASYVLAVLAGISQYFQIKFSLPPTPKKQSGKPSFSDDLARSMSMNMKYVMPVFIALIASRLPAVIALYWITGAVFKIAHELLYKRRILSRKVDTPNV